MSNEKMDSMNGKEMCFCTTSLDEEVAPFDGGTNFWWWEGPCVDLVLTYAHTTHIEYF